MFQMRSEGRNELLGKVQSQKRKAKGQHAEGDQAGGVEGQGVEKGEN